jgi:hypothetical protein
MRPYEFENCLACYFTKVDTPTKPGTCCRICYKCLVIIYDLHDTYSISPDTNIEKRLFLDSDPRRSCSICHDTESIVFIGATLCDKHTLDVQNTRKNEDVDKIVLVTNV